jgi:uncharacterized oligopeptide transporter (OPT) family protein
MSTRTTLVRVLVVVLAAATVAVPATAATTVEPCATDRRFVNAWNKVFNQHVRITARQTQLLGQIFTLLAANEKIPREVVTELQTLIAKQRQLIASGLRTLTRTKVGTANGVVFKRLVLRYLRVVARPLNNCIAKLLVADSPSELQAVIGCVDSTERARVSLQRSLDSALEKMAVRRSKCA